MTKLLGKLNVLKAWQWLTLLQSLQAQPEAPMWFIPP